MRKLDYLLVAVATISAAASALHCSSSPDDLEAAASHATTRSYVDCEEIAGVPGRLPKDDSLTELENIGRCTWVLSTGRTSQNPRFKTRGEDGQPVPAGLDGSEELVTAIAKKNGIIAPLGLVLSAKSEADRVKRWKDLGVMNDPDCRAAPEPDEFGLQLDECEDPWSAGAIGFRKFENPRFDRSKWNIEKYGTDRNMEPPYLIGMTCGSCHTSFDPLRPPSDPAHPAWENLVFTIGNQYLSEGALFAASTKGPEDFKWHVLDSQPRGTSDTGRIPTDHINNPNSINSLLGIGLRPWHDEKLKAGQVTYDIAGADLRALNRMHFEEAAAALRPIVAKRDGEVHRVQSILKGGEDSVGPVGALLRVYVNIGMCSSIWLKHFDPIEGMGETTSLGVDELDGCAAYREMLPRVVPMVLFLVKQGPALLRDAPGGRRFIDERLVDEGKLVFADNCASCHSSKQPPPGAEPRAWFRDEVMKPDFLERNYLSDDKSYPVTQIGTNAQRSMHSNHMKGQVWSDPYASQSYDERKFPGPIKIENPVGEDFEFTGRDGGPGYYRTPSLISLWTRAPFLHNKSVGLYNGDPSVEGRMEAYEDAAMKLLSPEKRGAGFIRRTSADSTLELGVLGLKLDIPAGTPINLFANLDPNKFSVKKELFVLAAKGLVGFDIDDGTLDELIHLSECPDLIEDKGHTFGAELAEADKRALIEYMKTM